MTIKNKHKLKKELEKAEINKQIKQMIKTDYICCKKCGQIIEVKQR